MRKIKRKYFRYVIFQRGGTKVFIYDNRWTWWSLTECWAWIQFALPLLQKNLSQPLLSVSWNVIWPMTRSHIACSKTTSCQVIIIHVARKRSWSIFEQGKRMVQLMCRKLCNSHLHSKQRCVYVITSTFHQASMSLSHTSFISQRGFLLSLSITLL